MATSKKSYTATMAKLYADQGYLRKSAEIYRYLIKQQPHRNDFKAALAEVERQMNERKAPTLKDTELLLREWITMLKKSRHRKRSGQTNQGGRRNENEKDMHN